MERRSRFVFGAEELLATLDSPSWLPADETVGGSRVSAAGIPASYVVRRDAMLELTLRIRESEWASLVNLVAYGQTGAALTWFPDQDDDTTFFQVYLHSPAAGERWGPTRLASYPRVLEVQLTLRGALGDVPWLPYIA